MNHTDTPAMETQSKEQKRDFIFFVTGFGKFNGVPENPTSDIVKELPEFLRQKCQDTSLSENVRKALSFLATRTETLLIETSAQAVQNEINVIKNRLQHFQSAIVLHLGVHYQAKRFRLEQCAYNDASFRVPDEKGFQPKNLPILQSCALGSKMTTSFDVPALVKRMNQTLLPASDDDSLPLANQSTDPGRFVCNYIYCASLDAFDCGQSVLGKHEDSQSSPRTRSLFLHVPPFTAIAPKAQLEFVTQLMLELCHQHDQYTALS